jgi:hypothetical protein
MKLIPGFFVVEVFVLFDNEVAKITPIMAKITKNSD